MQTLKLVSRLFPEVKSGDKTSTIRWRERRIEPGYLRYECLDNQNPSLVVWVWRCTDMPLSEAAAFLGKDADWPPTVMLQGMREHYPEIQLADVVQVVEHESPEQTKRRTKPANE
ncbi:ASCH domain-containing protein [Paraburkholderia nodosa]|uniref:ASCH domain-containing protein n=1 Tax=Paraburkholderia nodosa TaxID=392320 RepID=UPI000489334E|nr:ASCH domain-containing protein [Paraburkholderia nodosa]